MKRRTILAAIVLPLSARPAAAEATRNREEVTLPADPSGRLHWAARVERGRARRGVTLVLRAEGPGGARQLWRDTWRDAYEPSLRAIPDWLARGRPLVALTLRYGAGAQEAILLERNGAGLPRRVAERLASAIEWRRDARGRSLLVAYDRDGSAAVPECLDWNGGALEPVPCGAVPPDRAARPGGAAVTGGRPP